MTTQTIRLAFTQEDVERAHEEWGCNCGPASLAAALGLSLEDVRPAFEEAGFAERRYTNPTIMRQAARRLGAKITPRSFEGIIFPSVAFPHHGIIRIQWEGPWTAPGANPKWAYRHTHWIASWVAKGSIIDLLDPVVFDINGGLMNLDEWEEKVAPRIVESIPRADGDWSLTHSWELSK